MSFAVPAGSYDRYMGRYSRKLAPRFAEFAGVRPGSGERYDGFDDYWQPFTAGVGPGGAYCVALEPERREALREECRRRLGDPSGPFELRARAWAVRGVEDPSSP